MKREYKKKELESAVRIWIASEQEKAMRLTLVKAESLRKEGKKYSHLPIPNLTEQVKVVKVGYRKSRENQVKAYLADGLKLLKATFEVGGPNGEVLVPVGIEVC